MRHRIGTEAPAQEGIENFKGIFQQNLRGLLSPIEGWWKISSVPPKRVTVDAGREAQQNRADVERGKSC